MKRLIYTLMPVLWLAACSSPGKAPVTDTDDYNASLGQAAPEPGSKYFDIWNSKIRPDSMQLTSFGVVAGEYTRYFNQTGDIAYLKKAEQALTRALEIAAVGRAGFCRSLARNYISQHRFGEALELVKEAMEVGSGMRANHALMFDVLMELGRYTEAETHLDALEDMGRIDYLIRLAKWSDHRGDLKKAIFVLELATEKAQRSGNPTLVQWCYTNLADYYGHAGEVQGSYRYYLKALAEDPANAYAKKGIAWIAYSYERRPEEALRILDSVTSYYESPDIWLLKSEIAAGAGDMRRHSRYLDRFTQLAADPAYGNMYNTYTIGFCLENTGQLEKAVALAEQEAASRPTPQTRGLLAYAYYRNGMRDKALRLVRSAVDGKTHEPLPLLYAAEIYKAAGMERRAAALAAELEDAVFELGPDTEKRVEALKM